MKNTIVMGLLTLSLYSGVTMAQACVSLTHIESLRKMPDMSTPLDPCTFQPLSTKDISRIDRVVIGAHPDDETIGMSGWIATQVKEQKNVVVEMLTDGLGSGAQRILGTKGHQLTDEEFGDARIREYISSMRVLGIKGIRFHNKPSMRLYAADVAPIIDYWKDHADTLPLFNVNAGGDHDSSNHPDHHSIYLALKKAQIPKENKSWSLIYAFRLKDAYSRWPEDQVTLLPDDICLTKRKALNQYRIFLPELKRYAIGWTNSTPDLFQGAYDTCREYQVRPDQKAFVWEVKPLLPLSRFGN